MKRAPDFRWLTALVLALGLLASTAIVLSLPPVPEPGPAAPSATATPAPLPPATGVDGEALAAPGEAAQPDGLPADPEQLPADVQAQPEAGAPATIVESEGTGGEVYVSSPAWKGKQRLNAGYRYPSGSLHAAWDIGIKRGTKIYAAKAGLIVGKQDGVKNHPSGSQYAVSGSPSNWLLLCATVKNRPAVLYYQHLSPGLKVKRGQNVVKGKHLGASGNTGNSTGDHLHISASYSPWGCKKITPSRAEFLRYDYLRTPSRRVFAPAEFWKTPPPKAAKPAIDSSAAAKACRTNASAANFRYARKALGMKNTATDKCGANARKRYKAWQRELGYRGKAADGIPGYASLSALGQRGGFRVVR